MEINFVKIQQTIFQDIIFQLGSKKKLVEWMIKNIGISSHGCYRRLSGKTLLDLREYYIILREFKLPVYSYIDMPLDELTFQIENNKPKSYEEWLETTEANFSLVCSQPNVSMHYSSSENPIFHHFHFEEITRFKLYIWARAVWELPELHHTPFSIERSDLWTEKAEEYRKKMLKNYISLPSIEFWTPNIMNNNLGQIQYYLEADQFANRKDSLLLCEQLHEMVRLMHIQTEKGYKQAIDDDTDTGIFELHYNEILHTNNTLFFQWDEGNALYTSFGNPTMIKTRQKNACNHAEDWFNQLKKRSMKLSIYSERERFRLFNKMHDKIRKAEQFFNGII